MIDLKNLFCIIDGPIIIVAYYNVMFRNNCHPRSKYLICNRYFAQCTPSGFSVIG